MTLRHSVGKDNKDRPWNSYRCPDKQCTCIWAFSLVIPQEGERAALFNLRNLAACTLPTIAKGCTLPHITRTGLIAPKEAGHATVVLLGFDFFSLHPRSERGGSPSMFQRFTFLAAADIVSTSEVFGFDQYICPCSLTMFSNSVRRSWRALTIDWIMST